MVIIYSNKNNWELQNVLYYVDIYRFIDFRLHKNDKGDDNGVVLQSIKPHFESHTNPSFSMESETDAPPPYSSPKDRYRKRDNSGITTTPDNMVDASNGSKGVVFQSLSNGSVEKDGEKMDSSLSGESSHLDIRKRHKSEGAVPNSPSSKTFLDPNYRKNSMYESKSTISGAKFEDSFVGK